MTLEEIGKILVEKGERGCWHGAAKIESGSASGLVKISCDCGLQLPNGGNWPNPDFSNWGNFGRL